VIAEPPFEVGALQASATVPLPGVALVRVGTPGVVAGFAESSLEVTLSPTAFTAETL